MTTRSDKGKAKQTTSGLVTESLWLVTIDGTGDKSDPLFVPGDTLAEVERRFKELDDMGYQIKRVEKVGRIPAWKSWAVRP